MINLRNLPFFAVGVALLLFGVLVFDGTSAIACYVLTVVYFVLGIVYRNDGSQSHSH